jgi:hypothetical protein
VAQAKEKIGEVLKAIEEFKKRLLGVLKKAANTIDIILDDPIQFLKYLLSAIKQGFNQFVDNIWTHLKAGFIAWLFGSLTKLGIELPTDLNLWSILKLVLGVLGITYARMREKAVKLLGPTAVTIIEKVGEYIYALITGGPQALWEKVKEDLSNLKEMVIDAIQDWLITTLIKKAVAKIVSLFNPAGAIIQAILLIVDVVRFVVEKANQILDFVEAVVNSLYDIATGSIGTAANWIEKALGKMIPILIGFLADLLGLGGITEKIKEFIKKVQSKVDKAIDKAIAKVVALVKKLVGAVKSGAKALVQWWKMKTKFKAGEESHELSFHGEENSAELFVASNPQAVKDYIASVDSPTDAQKAAIAAIKGLLKQIKDQSKAKGVEVHDDQIRPLFDKVAVQLAIVMGLSSDQPVKKLKVPSRRSWNIDTLEVLKTEQEDLHTKKLGKGGRPKLKKGNARRHIVSSKDMAEHYESLNTKKWSLAKAMLEKAGFSKAHVAVDKKVNNDAIINATLKRHETFFNYADNLFVGPGKRNSALGRTFDPDYGGSVMTKKEVEDYVKGVKKDWALDGSFTPTL